MEIVKNNKDRWTHKSHFAFPGTKSDKGQREDEECAGEIHTHGNKRSGEERVPSQNTN